MYSLKPGRGPSLMGTVVLALMSCLGVVVLIGSNLVISGFAKEWDSMGAG